ncbi:helix-turn-helix domain-containing protein [Lentzea sp. NBRC 105346]|uniref:helix-turn-helix transcriptional regulator n=1 Tax=Lentzea sp. NBRC 105346 TaxID=3032205 RepID=UPI002552EAE4|nr:helix-turn-helix domain-containing protein [Lentzea sp. NBRC 105346]
MSTRRRTPADSDEFMDTEEFMAKLDIARSTFDDWRAKGKCPKWFRLPNGQLRCRRSEFNQWIDALEGAA